MEQNKIRTREALREIQEPDRIVASFITTPVLFILKTFIPGLRYKCNKLPNSSRCTGESKKLALHYTLQMLNTHPYFTIIYLPVATLRKHPCTLQGFAERSVFSYSYWIQCHHLYSGSTKIICVTLFVIRHNWDRF